MNVNGMKVLVMGLGLNGGGVEAARYLAAAGAIVTVTDLRDEAALAPSIAQLDAAGCRPRYVLGRHDTADFAAADLVIKNPGVRPDSPYLAAARRVETDLSLFLAASPARLIAVTGSKGKSTTASALHHALPGSFLGGNITVSPLAFLDALTPSSDVILELSSWQLADLRGRGLLRPRAAVLTTILPDHMDRYGGDMNAYVADKRVIYESQDAAAVTVAEDDPWGRSFLEKTPARALRYAARPLEPGAAGGWIDGDGGPAVARLPGMAAPVEVVPARPALPGDHQKKNLLAAALALLDLGMPAPAIRERLGGFTGIEHRLEFFHEAAGLRFYNDSAATIPGAALAAINAIDRPVVLVAGGADKHLDMEPLVEAAGLARAVVLLEGTGSARLAPLLRERGIVFHGPVNTVDAAVRAAAAAARPGDAVALSPGFASFGMFVNEFERGRRWKEAVRRFCDGS